jgi:hypothetical protein
MNISRWIVALVLAIAVAALPAFAAEELDTAPAMAVAERWLVNVDSGRYGQSWEEAAPYFREALAKTQWEMLLDTARGPLGVTIGRKIRSATYTRVIPGAPEGEYVVIQYDTRFANRPQSVESVTSMRGKDGTWKVAGYHIR